MDTMGAQLRILQNQALHNVDLLTVKGGGSGTDVSGGSCAGYFIRRGYVKKLKAGDFRKRDADMGHGGWLGRFVQFV